MAYFIVSLLCVFGPSIWGLIILRLFLQGFAGSAGVVISRAIVRDLYSGSELTKFFSLLALINGLAPYSRSCFRRSVAQSSPLARCIYSFKCHRYRDFFVVLFGLPETLQEKQRTADGIQNTFHAFSKLVTDRTFMGYALAQGLVTACLFSYISGSPFVIQDIYKASPQTFSLIFAANAIGIMICSQTTGRLAGKIPESTIFKFGLGMAALGAIILLILIFSQAN